MILFSERYPPEGTTFKATYYDERDSRIFKRGTGDNSHLFFCIDKGDEDLIVDYEDWFYAAGFLYWEELDDENKESTL